MSSKVFDDYEEDEELPKKKAKPQAINNASKTSVKVSNANTKTIIPAKATTTQPSSTKKPSTQQTAKTSTTDNRSNIKQHDKKKVNTQVNVDNVIKQVENLHIDNKKSEKHVKSIVELNEYKYPKIDYRLEEDGQSKNDKKHILLIQSVLLV